MNYSRRELETVCNALCQSGKFETGQGTCAPICMEKSGEARKPSCPRAVQVHSDLAVKVLVAI